jgi:hypothetical protein
LSDYRVYDQYGHVIVTWQLIVDMMTECSW